MNSSKKLVKIKTYQPIFINIFLLYLNTSSSIWKMDFDLKVEIWSEVSSNFEQKKTMSKCMERNLTQCMLTSGQEMRLSRPWLVELKRDSRFKVVAKFLFKMLVLYKTDITLKKLTFKANKSKLKFNRTNHVKSFLLYCLYSTTDSKCS